MIRDQSVSYKLKDLLSREPENNQSHLAFGWWLSIRMKILGVVVLFLLLAAMFDYVSPAGLGYCMIVVTVLFFVTGLLRTETTYLWIENLYLKFGGKYADKMARKHIDWTAELRTFLEKSGLAITEGPYGEVFRLDENQSERLQEFVGTTDPSNKVSNLIDEKKDLHVRHGEHIDVLKAAHADGGDMPETLFNMIVGELRESWYGKKD